MSFFNTTFGLIIIKVKLIKLLIFYQNSHKEVIIIDMIICIVFSKYKFYELLYIWADELIQN